MGHSMTTIYLFDHASGFDWNVDRAKVEHELGEYRRAGWVTGGDGLYRIDVPITLEDGVNNDEVTAYLESEDWAAMGADVLWRPQPNEVQQDS